jgi:hypothetical protein
MKQNYETKPDGTILPYPTDTQLPIKITKELQLNNNQIKDIIIKYLHDNFNLSGIFDVRFIVRNHPKPGIDIHDSVDSWEFNGANIRISENNS